ncbi:MAG: EF-P lysine aminoacylase GenX [Deltaproteobacteria bacterium HGW-Deltaproteobacteria-4]|nr:MAG: EF-P lysine aminoacylase GenX [Deltaproteobacteria bacterium HGW-Deltaproteobacteria-4]
MAGNWQLAKRRPALEARARIVQTIRAFFIDQDFLEVETPQRIPVNAPELHIDAVRSGSWFLHTSPELCMKRLLAAGYPRLFQICRVWREGERGGRHLPEFTMLEWYRSDADYLDLMDDCEALLRALVPSRVLKVRGTAIDLSPAWERLTVADAFAAYAPLSLAQALAADRFDEILTSAVEPRLGQGRPTFLYDYPAQLAALARRKANQLDLAERFELYIAGIEIANAFSELTDPDEQRQRLASDESARRALGKTPLPLPEPFLAELTHLPPSAGIALGVDRLVMLLIGAASLDAVVAFPPEEL